MSSNMPKLSTRDNDLYRIGHMIDFCEKPGMLTKDSSEEILEEDWMKTYAIMELFQLLGEAASKVSDELKLHYPHIPWQDAKDLRNRLIHGYDDIDYRRLLDSMKTDIPPLLDQLRKLEHGIRMTPKD